MAAQVLLVLAMLVPQMLALDNGVALTPPRGFSTWNAFPVHSIDEATCYKYLDALVKHGLHKLNYTYFIVDEPCFAGRAADGTLIENKTTWPTGLKKFGEVLRTHGMKLGTYTCVGPKTCGGCIASEGHEDQDVATFAEMGVEYLKVDSCSRNCTAAAGVPNATQCGETLWSRYTRAIAKHKTIADEQMVYSIVCNCDPSRGQQPWKWAKDFANSWRTNIDIQGGFGAISYVLDAQRRMSGNGSWCPSDPKQKDGKGSPCADGKDNGACPTCPGPESFSGIGHWNDMDMLIIGTQTNFAPPFCANCSCHGGGAGKKPICTGCDSCARPMHWSPLSVSQSRAQLSLWTIMKSPLIESADLTSTAPELIEVLSNTEVLAVSDDPLGKEAIRLGDSGRNDRSVGEIYVGELSGGGHAVVMFNRGAQPERMVLELSDIVSTTSPETPNAFAVRDLWTHTANGTVSGKSGTVSAMVPPQDVVMITLSPTATAAMMLSED